MGKEPGSEGHNEWLTYGYDDLERTEEERKEWLQISQRCDRCGKVLQGIRKGKDGKKDSFVDGGYSWIDGRTLCANPSIKSNPHTKRCYEIELEELKRTDTSKQREQSTMKTTGLNFIEAVKAAKNGKEIQKASWEGRVPPLYCVDDEFLYTDDGSRCKMSLDDILAEDWEIVESEPTKPADTVKSLKNREVVIELCPHCGQENCFEWYVQREGLQAFCYSCGGVLMLCNECPDIQRGVCGQCPHKKTTPEPPKTMGFMEAMENIKEGKTVRRLAWSDHQMFVRRSNETINLMEKHYYDGDIGEGRMIVKMYVVPISDVNATDWIVVTEEPR